MKRPAFQFYPADWRKDAELQSCSLAAQGLWVNLMCIAHECEPYGHLLVNGKPMTPAQIGRLVGLSVKEADKLLTELHEAGVSSMTEAGAIYSRRMVKDERQREIRAEVGRVNGAKGAEHGKKGAEHGAKGGRPPKPKDGQEPPSDEGENGGEERGRKPPQNPLPSSSSSSSPSGIHRAPGFSLEAGAGAEAAARPLSGGDPQEANGHQPTPAGRVCRAMKAAGMAQVNPGDPRMLALLDQGATIEEFAGLAAEAVEKSRGFAWVLTVLQARRVEAAAIKLTAKAKVTDIFAGAD